MTLKNLTSFNDVGRLSILASPLCAPTFPRCLPRTAVVRSDPLHIAGSGRIGLRGIRGWRRQLKTAGNQRSNILTFPRGESFGSVSIERYLSIRVSNFHENESTLPVQPVRETLLSSSSRNFLSLASKRPLARLFLPS